MITITITIEDKGNRIVVNGLAIDCGAAQSELDESKRLLAAMNQTFESEVSSSVIVNCYKKNRPDLQ